MTTPRVGADAPNVDLLINGNETFRGRFTYRVDGVAQPLDDFTARLSIAYRKGGRPVFTITEGDGITLEPLDPDTQEPLVGVIDIHISAPRTALLRRNGVYDLLLLTEDENPETDRLFEGVVYLDRGVTGLT